MKRLQLFEFEDFSWFPKWIRSCITRLITVMHQFLGTPGDLGGLVSKVLKHSPQTSIIDLCSGSGGPMIEVVKILESEYGINNIKLTLTDLYPDEEAARKINQKPDNIQYLTSPVDATNIGSELVGLKTMIGSFHHMHPEAAKKILLAAQESKRPICIYEISDNNLPKYLWWISLPMIFIMVFFITLFVRPLTWKQLIFTYLVPVIPIFFAWDGAVSNARTYTLKDLDELTSGLSANDYTWEKGRISGRGNKLYLLGTPRTQTNV